MRKGIISIFTVFFLATTVILGILLLNAKRQQLAAIIPAIQKEEVKEAKLPAPRSYAAVVKLPAPKTRGTMSVEEALQSRRTARAYLNKPVSLAQLSQMLWAAQGITIPNTDFRTAPSAFNIYPYTVYVVVRNVTGLTPGLYEYLPKQQALGDMKLTGALDAFDASGVEAGAKKSPVVILLAAAFDKGLAKMPAGTEASTYLEGGHIGENLYLQAESLNLGMVVMGGGTQAAHDAMKLDAAEKVVYVIPFGYPAPTPSPTPTAKEAR